MERKQDQTNELDIIVNQLRSIYYRTKYEGHHQGLVNVDWPLTEMIYATGSILKEISQFTGGGYFSRKYLDEKIDVMRHIVEMMFCKKCNMLLAGGDISVHKYCEKCRETVYMDV